MVQWYVKDLSKLTCVSVQTLHHYDRIGLLKPSLKLANGYRVYSEKDLSKLQQVIALKFFGFSLAQIKLLLANNDSSIDHLTVQARFLEEKANSLMNASKTLQSVIADIDHDRSIPWKKLIQLIEVYRMTQQLEHSWVKEIFTPEELKQYATFETELKANATKEQKAEFEANWQSLVDEMNHHLKDDPQSEIGIRLGEKCMKWLNEVYGKKYANLRTKKFEKGFAEGKGLDEVGLTPETVLWLDQAINAYWKWRIHDLLGQVGKKDPQVLLKLWNDILDEMYGNEEPRKQDLLNLALSKDDVSAEAKEWLKSLL